MDRSFHGFDSNYFIASSWVLHATEETRDAIAESELRDCGIASGYGYRLSSGTTPWSLSNGEDFEFFVSIINSQPIFLDYEINHSMDTMRAVEAYILANQDISR